MTASPPPSRPPITARRAILSSGIWIALSTLVPFVATAALSVVAGRVLGAELLGQQSLIAFSGALAVSVLVTSLTDASIRTLSAARTGTPGHVVALERWTSRAHLVAGTLTAAGLALVGLQREDMAAAWLAMAGTVLLDAVGWSWSSRIIGRDGWSPVARRRLVSQLLAVVLGIAAVLAGLGITGIFVGAAIATAVLLVLLRPIVPPAAGPAVPSSSRPVRRLWLLFAVGALLTQVVSGRIEILFLSAFATGTEVAHYSVAVMLVTSAVTLPAALAGAAMPAVAAASGAGDARKAADALVRALRVTAVLSLPLTAVIVAVGPAFVTGLYGDEFVEAGALTRLAALGAVVIPCGRLATSYWSGVGRLRLPITAGVVGAVLEVGLALALIPSRGATGAVVATLVGQGTAAAVLVVLSWRSLGVVAVGGRGWVSAALASSAAGAAGAAAASDGGLTGAVAGGLVLVAVFVVLAAVLGRLGVPVLDPEDGRWLRAALPERAGPLVRPLTRD